MSSFQLKENARVLGVDKRLLLIEPTESGHIERGVIGYEHIIALKWGISSTGVMFNIFMFLYRYNMIEGDD